MGRATLVGHYGDCVLPGDRFLKWCCELSVQERNVHGVPGGNFQLYIGLDKKARSKRRIIQARHRIGKKKKKKSSTNQVAFFQSRGLMGRKNGTRARPRA